MIYSRRIYNMPEQMQDQWRERMRQRSARRLFILAGAFFVLVIVMGAF